MFYICLLMHWFFIILGLCMVYVQESNYFNSYNCTTFEDGCPDMFYLSDESYKCKFRFRHLYLFKIYGCIYNLREREREH